jgi:Reverse transcriptase (RNA-dependent DNA polymerase).
MQDQDGQNNNAGKTVALILSRRLESKIEQVMEKCQFEFRKSKDARVAIGLIRIKSERLLDVKEEIGHCFIDWQKTFDLVDWTKLLEMLRYIRVNWRERPLICNLYMGQRVKLRHNQGETDSVKIGRVVRQGCCMPHLLYLDEIRDFKIGERTSNKVRFADNTAIIAKTQKELQDRMSRLVDTGNKYGMGIDIEKSQVMRVSRSNESLQIMLRRSEEVDYVKYLESVLTR